MKRKRDDRKGKECEEGDEGMDEDEEVPEEERGREGHYIRGRGPPRRHMRRGRPFDPFFDFGTDMDAEFERMREYMDRMMEQAMRGLPDRGPGKPFVYGFTLRTGPDGKPVFQVFGNTNRVRRLGGPPPDAGAGTECGPGEGVSHYIEGGREPLTDVIDCGDTIAITVELPGVEKDDIQLEVAADILVIKVDNDKRRYFKEVELPAEVKDDSTKASYKNGVLDITLQKTTGERRKGKRVSID